MSPAESESLCDHCAVVEQAEDFDPPKFSSTTSPCRCSIKMSIAAPATIPTARQEYRLRTFDAEKVRTLTWLPPMRVSSGGGGGLLVASVEFQVVQDGFHPEESVPASDAEQSRNPTSISKLSFDSPKPQQLKVVRETQGPKRRSRTDDEAAVDEEHRCRVRFTTISESSATSRRTSTFSCPFFRLEARISTRASAGPRFRDYHLINQPPTRSHHRRHHRASPQDGERPSARSPIARTAHSLGAEGLCRTFPTSLPTTQRRQDRDPLTQPPSVLSITTSPRPPDRRINQQPTAPLVYLQDHSTTEFRR